MSSNQSAKKVGWTVRSKFILEKSKLASEKKQLRGTWMWSGAWVDYIHNNFQVPNGYEFTMADLNMAIRNDKANLASGIDFKGDMANDHGIYRDVYCQVNPKKLDGKRTDQWYYVAVAPKETRPKAKKGALWYDGAWTKPPTPAKKIEAGADVAAEAKAKRKYDNQNAACSSGRRTKSKSAHMQSIPMTSEKNSATVSMDRSAKDTTAEKRYDFIGIVLGLEGGYQLKDGAAGGNLQDAVLETIKGFAL